MLGSELMTNKYSETLYRKENRAVKTQQKQNTDVTALRKRVSTRMSINKNESAI